MELQYTDSYQYVSRKVGRTTAYVTALGDITRKEAEEAGFTLIPYKEDRSKLHLATGGTLAQLDEFKAQGAFKLW